VNSKIQRICLYVPGSLIYSRAAPTHLRRGHLQLLWHNPRHKVPRALLAKNVAEFTIGSALQIKSASITRATNAYLDRAITTALPTASQKQRLLVSYQEGSHSRSPNRVAEQSMCRVVTTSCKSEHGTDSFQRERGGLKEFDQGDSWTQSCFDACG